MGTPGCEARIHPTSQDIYIYTQAQFSTVFGRWEKPKNRDKQRYRDKERLQNSQTVIQVQDQIGHHGTVRDPGAASLYTTGMGTCAHFAG